MAQQLMMSSCNASPSPLQPFSCFGMPCTENKERTIRLRYTHIHAQVTPRLADDVHHIQAPTVAGVVQGFASTIIWVRDGEALGQ